MNEALVAELEQEAGATRRVLERIPENRLAWRPHPRSMSLGQLALHVATIPGTVAGMLWGDGIDLDDVDFEPPDPRSRDEVLGALEEGVAQAREFLQGLGPAQMQTRWRVVRGEREVFAVPRAGAIRTLMLSHWVHHRAQLGVYLRLLDVPVPAVYGNSADENALG